MEDAIKLFQPGFMLRSFFAGTFFPIFYYVFSHAPPPYVYAEFYHDDIIYFISFSLLAGVATYTLHRSLLYPLWEWALDLGGGWLVSKNTIKRIERHWFALEPEQVETKLSTWGDYAHQQYCSAECVLLAALIAHFVADRPTVHDNLSLLISVVFIFALAGAVSDLRLRKVRECFCQPRQNRTPSSTAVGRTRIGPS
jgi:hypothetical protein